MQTSALHVCMSVLLGSTGFWPAVRCCTGQLRALPQSKHPLGCQLPSCHPGLQVFRNQASAVIAGLPSLEEATTAHFQMQSAGPVSMEEGDGQAAAEPQLQTAAVAEVVAEAMEVGDKPEPRKKGTQGASPCCCAVLCAGPGMGSSTLSPDINFECYHADEMLYSEPGQFNPRAARAAKKRQKKQKS